MKEKIINHKIMSSIIAVITALVLAFVITAIFSKPAVAVGYGQVTFSQQFKPKLPDYPHSGGCEEYFLVSNITNDNTYINEGYEFANYDWSFNSSIYEPIPWPNPQGDPQDVYRDWNDHYWYGGWACQDGHSFLAPEAGTYQYEVQDLGPSGNMERFQFTVYKADASHQNVRAIISVEQPNGGVQMNKRSSCDWSENNPNYSYKNNNCVYDIFTDPNCSASTLVAQMVIDGNGHGQTDIHALKKGTYYVRENQSVHGTNYLWNPEVGWVNVYPDTLNWVYWDAQGRTITYDTPVDDPDTIEVGKCDMQTGKTEVPEGFADFSDAHYEFKYFYNMFQKEIDEPSEYVRHWIMKTDKWGQTSLIKGEEYKVDGDDFYYNSSHTSVAIPVGTYVVREVKAPEGYELSDNVYIMNVVSDSSVDWGATTKAYFGRDCDTWEKNASGKKVVVHHLAGEEITTDIIPDPHTGKPELRALEQVNKGDYKFVKKEPDEQHTMAYIPWKLTSKTTGEWHVLVTDKNGEVNTNSTKARHTQYTNYFDNLLTEGGEVPESGIDEAKISEFFEAGNFYGTWFCWDNEKGEYVPPSSELGDDQQGALPYDDYYLEELPVSANAGYILVNRLINISIPDWIVDGGTITNNPEPTRHITTSAYNWSDGSKKLDVTDGESLIDVVSYDDLEIGEEYTVFGTLYDFDTQEPLLDSLGRTITSTKKFVAEDDTGKVNVGFTFSTIGMSNKHIVVYEQMFNGKGDLIAKHEDITDWDQTVIVNNPTIKTELMDSDGDKEVVQSKDTKLIDKVSYKDIKVNGAYELYGQIINKADGAVIGDAHKYFMAPSSSGEVNVVFNIDTSEMTFDTELVCFETLLFNDNVICEHKDIDDANQTVHFTAPKIKTFLHNPGESSQTIVRDYEVSVIDTISYDGLSVNNKYHLEGQLMDKKTGKLLVDCSGKEVKTTKEFVADSVSGSVDVEYQLDTSSMAEDFAFVAFETLYLGDIELTAHKDIDDVAQTCSIFVPTMNITTVARGGHSGSATLYELQNETIIDLVSYDGVETGFAYRMVGLLMDADSGLPVYNEWGNPIVSEKEFVPSKSIDSVEVEFKVDSRYWAGKNIVVFEQMYDHTGVLRATHTDLKDFYQTVNVVSSEITTELIESTSGSHDIQRYADQVLYDVISYKNLCPGHYYKVDGILMNKNTQSKYINEVTKDVVVSSIEFVPEKTEGKVTIAYKFDSTLMERNLELVSFVKVLTEGERGKQDDRKNSFERVYYEWVVLEDFNDFAETVKIVTPEVVTEATYGDGNKYFIAGNDSVAKDAVSWSGLPVGKNVDVYSWFVYSDSGLPVTDGQVDDLAAEEAMSELVHALGGRVTQVNEGEEFMEQWLVKFFKLTNKIDLEKMKGVDWDTLGHMMYTKHTFMPKNSSGVENVEFNFDSSRTMAGKIVAYNVFVSDNTVVAHKTDIDDADESMEIMRSTLITHLSDPKGNKNIDPVDNDVLLDQIEYFTVIPGAKYTLRGQLVNKANRAVLSEASLEFEPEEMEGKIDQIFQINTSGLAGQDIVCFETLELNGFVACEHRDLDDMEQTVHVNASPVGPQTNDNLPWVLIALLVLALCGGSLYIARRRGWTFKDACSSLGGHVKEVKDYAFRSVGLDYKGKHMK